MVLLLTKMALDLWGQQHPMANIGRSIATESRKSASANFIVGPWGECLAWAVVYEHQNQWENDPEYKILAKKSNCQTQMLPFPF